MKTRIVGPMALASLASDIETALENTLADDVVDTEIHDIAATAINGSAGAYVAFGSGNALAAAVKKIQLSSTCGTPFEIAIGATAGAAVRKFIANQGEGPQILDCAMASGEKVWVKSLTTAGITSGYITINFLG